MSGSSITATGTGPTPPAASAAVDRAYAVAARALHVAHHTQTTDLADGASPEKLVANGAAVQAAELTLNAAAAGIAQHRQQAQAVRRNASPTGADAAEPPHLDPGTTVDVYL